MSSTAFHVSDSGELAHDRSDRIVYESTTGFLYYDPDGSGRHGATKFAQLDPNLTLKTSDFYIV